MRRNRGCRARRPAGDGECGQIVEFLRVTCWVTEAEKTGRVLVRAALGQMSLAPAASASFGAVLDDFRVSHARGVLYRVQPVGLTYPIATS